MSLDNVKMMESGTVQMHIVIHNKPFEPRSASTAASFCKKLRSAISLSSLDNEYPSELHPFNLSVLFSEMKYCFLEHTKSRKLSSIDVMWLVSMIM